MWTTENQRNYVHEEAALTTSFKLTLLYFFSRIFQEIREICLQLCTEIITEKSFSNLEKESVFVLIEMSCETDSHTTFP